MSDPNIVNPGDSSYNLPKPTDTTVGDVPSMPMERVLPRQQSTGLSRGIQQLGSPNVYVDSGNQQIIVADTVGQSFLPRVLMGDQKNKGDGFYVTKAGIDVTTASNDSDFIFNSNQNVFKIVKIDSGSINITVNGLNTRTIAHGLNYIPAILAYLSDGTSYQQLPSILSYSVGASIAISTFGFISVDAINVYVQVQTSSSVLVGASLPYKYYLLQETLN